MTHYTSKPKKTWRLKAYQLAMKNTKYDDKGKAVISSNDESVTETEWDDMFTQMKKKIR